MQILGNIWGRVRQLLCISKSEQTGQLPPDESTNERITKCPTNASNTPSPLPQHRPELCLFILKAINPNDNQVDSPRHEDIPPAELKPAIIESEPSRLIVILDALASCCVSEVEQQVVAISLSMTATKSTVFVAQNSDVPDAVLQHIRNMWKKICAIGQTIVHDPNHPPNEPCPDPNRTDETTKCEQDLRSAIYHFCWSKFRKRVTKRKIRYRHFVKNMRLAGKLPPEFEKFDELFDMVFALCTKNDKAIVVSRMISSIASDFHSLLRDLTLQETLENEYLDTPDSKDGFGLRRALEKIFALEEHIRNLFKLAYSPRLKDYLVDNLSVIPIPTAAKQINLCVRPDITTQLIKDGVTDANVIYRPEPMARILQRVDAKVTKMSAPRRHKGPDAEFNLRRPGSVAAITASGRQPDALRIDDVYPHAECALLAYHYQNPDPPVFTDFGCSKLRCRACQSYMDQFNKASISRNGQRFFSRGTHKKIYFPWVVPDLFNSSGVPDHLLTEEICHAMVYDLRGDIGRQVDTEWKRKLSDSTGASKTLGSLPLPDVKGLEEGRNFYEEMIKCGEWSREE